MIKNKNIILQEEEFLKLNAEIDSKTKDLLSQVDHIKEIQSDNDKLFSDWQQSESVLSSDTKEKSENDGNRSNTSSEVNYALTEYLTKVCGETDAELLQNVESKNSAPRKTNFRKNLKPSQSAKVSASMSTTNLGDEFVPFGTRSKSIGKLQWSGIGNEVIPDTLKDVGQDGITRFLTAKVKLLMDQLEVVQKDEKKHLDKIKELQADKCKLEEDKDKLNQQANSTRNALLKYEQHLNNMTTQLKSTQAENSHLKRELEIIKKEMRESSKSYNTNELKLNRTLEEVEKLKSLLQQLRQEDKETKESHRRRTEELLATIKKQDRQRVELVNGFKKQLLIIDNLKSQKGLIEANKLLKSAEEDFLNFLDSNPPSVLSQKSNRNRKS